MQIHKQTNRTHAKILQWLKTEIYSSSEILTLVFGLIHRQSLHKLLMTIQEQGLIRYAKVPLVRGHQNLWGITEHGQALAYDPNKNETPSAKVFEPRRISALRLKHVLGLQKMKWQAIQSSVDPANRNGLQTRTLEAPARARSASEERKRNRRRSHRHYAAELAAGEEAQPRANSLAGTVGKLFGK